MHKQAVPQYADYIIQSHHSTWVEHFSNRLGKVAILLEVLRQGCVVPSVCPPVRVEIIQASSVRASTRQEGCPAGPAERLLPGTR